MVTDWVAATPKVVTPKTCVFAPALIVTLAGTVATAVLLLERVTTTPPAGVTPFSVTIPVPPVPPVKALGVSVTETKVAGLTVRLKLLVTEFTPLALAVTVIAWLLTSAVVADACNVMVPPLPVPGCMYPTVTPAGRLLAASVMLPVKLVRVRFNFTDCGLPPGTSVTTPGLTLLMAMLGGRFTARLKLLVTELTPLPLAVMVTVKPLTRAAPLAACKLMLPELVVPGWVIVAVTPLGRVLVVRVTLPV